jgi:hypothetical protein
MTGKPSGCRFPCLAGTCPPKRFNATGRSRQI